MKRIQKVLAAKGKMKKDTPPVVTLIASVAGAILIIGVMVGALIFIWPESDAPFRAHLRDYLKLMMLAGPLQPRSLTGKMVVVDVGAQNIDPVHFKLPDKLRARSPKEVKAVVLLRWERVEAVSYRRQGEWRGGSVFPGYRWDCQVTVNDWGSGRQANTKIVGDLPPEVAHSERERTGPKPVDKVIEYLVGLSAG